jgi:hypothetical protein
MTPSDEQRKEIRQLDQSLAELHERLSSGSSSELFAEFLKQGDTAILAANEAGLVYFASILMSLAAQASPGQHYHFDTHSALSRNDLELILQFLDGPSPEQNRRSLSTDGR